MTKSLEQLQRDAETLHQKLYGMSRELAVLEIVSAFIDQITDAHREVMDSVETRLLHKDHH